MKKNILACLVAASLAVHGISAFAENSKKIKKIPNLKGWTTVGTDNKNNHYYIKTNSYIKMETLNSVIVKIVGNDGQITMTRDLVAVEDCANESGNYYASPIGASDVDDSNSFVFDGGRMVDVLAKLMCDLRD